MNTQRLAGFSQGAPVRDLQTILDEWRAAERRLAAAEGDSTGHAHAAADVNRLRAEYHRTYLGQSGQEAEGRRDED
ncbi:MAG TPA: hypothetical protein VJK49_06530 [Candidatus Limnocylindrales bacterium]|nr:hypothetical protein [Candidatus Limnocylindrales bacterium]